MENKNEKIELYDADGNVVITIEGTNGNYQAGGHGHDGDITLTDAQGRATIRLNGFDGAIILGGPDQDGDLRLKNAKDQETVHLNGRSANLFLGGNGEDGDIFIKNGEGSEVILLDGKTGDIKVKGKSVATADHVFEADYPLPTIAELERFIGRHKHLPEIPTAAEMKDNGLSINQLATSLLKKVEELTLYLIGQHKTIEAQQSRIDELEKRLNP